MATYSPSAVARTRAALRWNLTRGNIWPGPTEAPPDPDVAPATLAALRRTLRTSADPIPMDAPPRPPQVSGPSRHCQVQLSVAAGYNCASWPTPQTPFEIASISVSSAIPAAVPGAHSVNLYLYATGDDRTGAPGQPTEPMLFPSTGQPGGRAATVLEVGAGNANSVFLTPHIPVERPDNFLTAWMDPAAAAFLTVGLGITLTEIGVQRLIVRPLIMQPQVLTRSLTAAPLPPGKGSTLPRGLRVSVLQAGQTMYSREIAWASADVELKKQFLNAQLSGNYPPTLQPIW